MKIYIYNRKTRKLEKLIEGIDTIRFPTFAKIYFRFKDSKDFSSESLKKRYVELENDTL